MILKKKLFLQALSTAKVIFNAEKDDGEDTFTGKIRFNRVTVNEGSGMSSDGFIAPHAGLYKMSFSVQGGVYYLVANTCVMVLKNGSHVFSIADSNDHTFLDDDGNDISYDWIMELKKGDKLTLKVNSVCQLRAGSTNPLNFNGQLIYLLI